MANDITALDALITQVGTVIDSVQATVTGEDSLVTEIVADVTSLLAKVSAGGTTDFTNEITALQAKLSELTTAQTTLQTDTANLQTAANAAKPVTGQ